MLEDIVLRLNAGEAVSIIGRNGVGKTTLLATAMGHTALAWRRHPPVRQGYLADGGASPLSRRLGYVPQEREVFPSLTVGRTWRWRRVPGAWTKANCSACFRALPNAGSNRGNQLSGGEQQMLSIARALIGNPACC